MRFKKVHFLGPKGPLFGGPAPPKVDPGYGRLGARVNCCGGRRNLRGRGGNAPRRGSSAHRDRSPSRAHILRYDRKS